MTLSVANRYPASGAVDAPRAARAKFDIVTSSVGDQVVRSSVNVWVNGSHVIANGAASTGADIADNGLGGFSVSVSQALPAVAGDVSTIRVTASSTSAAALDDTWAFTFADDSGIYVVSSSPEAFTISTLSPTAFDIVLRDDDNAPQLRVADFSDSASEIVNNSVAFYATGTNSFEMRVGSLIEFTSGTHAGVRRRITDVSGPGLATFDGAPLSSAIGDFTVYRQRGLDVWIDGVRVIAEGWPDADAAVAGWVATATVLGNGDIQVAVTTVPVSWSRGYNIPIAVRVSDDVGNHSTLDYSVTSQNDRGPFVDGHDPAPDSKALALGASLSFNITAPDDISYASINIYVNGAAAVTAGSGVGNWSGSTVLPTTDGYAVTLTPTVDYDDGLTAFVDVSAADLAGVSSRHVFSVQFGTTQDTVTTSSSGVVRVAGFDLTQSSFAKPAELKHTGYAYDGTWYESGSPMSSVAKASWYVESGSFPLVGCVVAKSTSGWDVYAAGDSAPWMSCSPLVSGGWSMSGDMVTGIVDAAFGDDAELCVVTSYGAIVVSFVGDTAFRYDVSGRAESIGDVSQRDGDQYGGVPAAAFALPAGPYVAGHMSSWQRDGTRSRALALANAAAVVVVNDLGDDERDFVSGLKSVDAYADVVTVSVSGAVKRVVTRAFKLPSTRAPLAYAVNDGGAGTVFVGDWIDAIAGIEPVVMIDGISTPSIPSADVSDVDVIVSDDGGVTLAVVTPSQIDVIAVDYGNQSLSDTLSLSDVDLGLDGIASSSLSAVSLEDGAGVDDGYMYAATAAPADGRVVHFRIHGAGEPGRVSVVDSGSPYASVSAMGVTSYVDTAFVRLAMTTEDAP